MKGRDHFDPSEAARIRGLLRDVRRAEPGSPQKMLRDQLRAIGFYISDWTGGSTGFTASEFDELVEAGHITIDQAAHPAARGPSDVSRASGPAAAEPKNSASSTTELAAQAREALRAPTWSIAKAIAGAVPDGPGLYAMHGTPAAWQALGLGLPPDGRPLYVGKAEASLVARDLKTHFASGTTGRSSPRRSFAALLAEDLGLVAMPRRPARPELGKWTHYALEEAGDARLTEWMRGNLKLAVWPSPPGAKLADVEGAVMRAWLPPLNLIGITTPWTTEIRRARAVLADRAKHWARERGIAID